MSQDLTATAPCWNCKRTNPTHVLPGVRLTLCQCKAMFPSQTKAQFNKSSAEAGMPLRERLMLAD